MRRRRIAPRVAIAGVVMGAIVGAGCSGSGPAATTTATSSPAVSSTTPVTPARTVRPPTPSIAPAPRVAILSLTGPATPVPCNAPTSIAISWATRHATGVTLRIDGGAVFARYSNGVQRGVLVPLACDGRPHAYVLAARGPRGTTARRVLTITERRSA